MKMLLSWILWGIILYSIIAVSCRDNHPSSIQVPQKPISAALTTTTGGLPEAPSRNTYIPSVETNDSEHGLRGMRSIVFSSWPIFTTLRLLPYGTILAGIFFPEETRVLLDEAPKEPA